jgi:hypothetical protein
MLYFLSPDAAFQAVNAFALLFWIFLAVLPKWAYTRRIVLFGGVLLLSVAYLSLSSVLLSVFGDGMSLATISKGFQSPQTALLGWVHYLAFDLFVGAWEVHDSQANNISHWFVIPCLFLTFMAGPIGLLLYFILRTIRTKQMHV